MKFDVTFEIITEESASYGAAAESGFEGEDMAFRDAVELIRRHGGYVEPSDSTVRVARWFVSIPSEMDYRTGEYRSLSIHIPEAVTAASRVRIGRLLGAYGV